MGVANERREIGLPRVAGDDEKGLEALTRQQLA